MSCMLCELYLNKVVLKILTGTSLVVQWLRLHAPSEGGLGLIPNQETRSHKPQLRVGLPQQRLKILYATTKTRSTQKK